MFEQQAQGQRRMTIRLLDTWSQGKRQSAGKCNLRKPVAKGMALASGREVVMKASGDKERKNK